eukprot:gnl/MRDRNA2_/MRDRNA2_58689_c0_seq1.p1 gnl/MRDRNA2_/MRDRNA2_58689_c0~~gnl/MRDRNA2_/MRDRNA2_58689_c0_seq1.p1  ORF type:complete len:828 (-),score=265.05 gnl/MRDRNA2_/MRDRNA2_58689_c0_seq1:381-2837(-)
MTEAKGDGEGSQPRGSNAKEPEIIIDPSIGPKEGQSYHAAIAEATSRVAKTLSGLYNSKSDKKGKYSAEASGGRPPLERQKTLQRQKTQADPGDGSARKEESDDEDNWNLDEAKQTVKELLNSLQTERRTREMDGLREWFEAKAEKVPGDEDNLKYFFEDCSKGEETHKHALEEIEMDVNDRVESKDRGLKKFEQVLNTMVKQGRSTAQEWKNKQKQLERDKAELVIDNDHLVELEDSIQNLRQKLLLKESDANNDDSAQKAADLEEKDILAVINAQEKELKSLNARWDINERRVKMLRVAFHYVSNGAVGPAPAEMVVDTLEEMKVQVRNTKIAEMLRAADLENIHLMEPPDDSEVQRLEEECQELQNKLEDVETQVALLQAPEDRERELQARLDAISGGQGGGIPKPMPNVTPEGSVAMKDELLRELALVLDKNTKLQPALATYEELLKNAEASLDVMADERLKFLNLIYAAKNNLAKEFEVDEDLDDDETRQRMEARRKEVLALLDEEENALLEGAEPQEMGIKAATQALQDEQRRVRELGWEFERQRDDSAEFELPQVTRSMIQESQKQATHSLMKLEADPLVAVSMISRVSLFRQKLEEEKRATQVEIPEVEALDEAQAEGEGKAELEGNDEEGTKKEPEADDEAKEKETEEPKTKEKPPPDMEGFIRLHNENLELVQELEDIETQLRALKSARGHPLDFDREGAMACESEEILQEIKQKQKELFDIRVAWWNNRQEPPRIPASVSRRNRKASKEKQASRQSTMEGDEGDGVQNVKRRSKLRSSRQERGSLNSNLGSNLSQQPTVEEDHDAAS